MLRKKKGRKTLIGPMRHQMNASPENPTVFQSSSTTPAAREWKSSRSLKTIADTAVSSSKFRCYIPSHKLPEEFILILSEFNAKMFSKQVYTLSVRVAMLFMVHFSVYGPF